MNINIRQRSLEELLDLLPVEVTINGFEAMFALSKDAREYSCYAYETMEGETVSIPGQGELCFRSSDPKNAVAMMIGWLKLEKLL